MATAAMARMRADRIFYSSVPLVVAAIVFAGFAPSWFLRPVLGTPPEFGPLSTIEIVHGTVFTSWIALTIVQPLLIASGNRRLHRPLGYIGAGVAVAMLPLILLATAASMKAGVPPVFPSPTAFFTINMDGMITFAIIVGLAIARRRDAETHKRLILLSLVVMMAPALARMPALRPWMPLSAFATPDWVILAGCLFDMATRGRVHRVWAIGGPLVIVSQVLMFPLGLTPMMHMLGDWVMQLPV
jgi:F0F1-type ATP synthase assembly protein I